MKYLKPYNTYLESLKIDVAIINVDINESLGLYYENILKSIGAEEVDMFDTFSLPKDDFADKLKSEIIIPNAKLNMYCHFFFKISNFKGSDNWIPFKL